MLSLCLNSRGRRAAIVCVGLSVYLVIAGVPLLHAFAHRAHEDGGPAEVAGERIAHSHDEIHPPSLHDECVMPTRGVAKVVVPAPCPPLEIGTPIAERAIPPQPDPGCASRAPPPDDPARAPPHA